MNPNNTILRLEGCVSQAVRGAAGFFLSRISWRQLNTFCATSPEWSLKWDYLVICLCSWYLLWLTPQRKKIRTDDGRKIQRKDFWSTTKAKAKERVLRSVYRWIPSILHLETKQLVLTAQRQQQDKIIFTLQGHMCLPSYSNKSLNVFQV